MSEQRELYIITNSQDTGAINRILGRIAQRLDTMEGLRGNPKFFSTLFEFSDGTSARITAGNYHVTQAWENDYK